ncbi:MAG: protein BatD [Alistipes sp.]|nr:protein BatD [Alistipes sp.]
MKFLGRYLHKTILLVGLLLSAAVAKADGDVTFEVSVPRMITQGEYFNVSFTLTNATPDEGSFEAPSFEGLDILAGPTESTGSQLYIMNGVRSQTSTYTLTYAVIANTTGNVTIGSAKVKVDGKSYTTKATPIEVVASQQSDNATNNHGSSVQKQLAQDDILLRLNLSRSSVYNGEPVRATLMLYTRAEGIAGLENFKLPSFDGFWSQELQVSANNNSRVNINDKVYDAYVLKDYLLYPQKAGELSIEPTTLTAIAQVVVQNGRYDPFFGRSADVYNVQRNLSTGVVKLTVKPLPEGAPATFNGAVGEFTLSSEVPQEDLEANSSATYVVKISGSGNINFLQEPTLTLPSSFELYDVRKSEKINTTSSGISGYKQFEYPFIMRSEGEYKIDGVEFTYFNPKTAQYITLRGKPMSLNIQPDKSSAITVATPVGRTIPSQEDVAQLGEDIRFIKLGETQFSVVAAPFMMSDMYYAILAAIVVLVAAAYFILSRRIKRSKNAVLMRNRRANKVAVQRFQVASRYMRGQNSRDFFSEMSRALWGYISDKLNIPVANLAKENIRTELRSRGVSEQQAQAFTDIITRCEEAQYSPLGSVDMNELYTDGVNIISHIESVIKK